MLCPEYLPALEGAVQIQFALSPALALPTLQRILKLQPENVTANAMAATALRAGDECAKALPNYAASAPLFSTRPDLLQGYGYCLAQTGDLPAALTQYTALLDSNPTEPVRYNVALLQWKTHAPDQALATLAPLLAGAANSAALNLASAIAEEHGQTPEAVALLRQAILADPDRVDNYLDFTAIAFAHRSFQVGIDMLDAGIKRLPTVAALRIARGVLEVQLSQSERAVADFEQAHRLDPTAPLALDALGIMRSQQYDSAAALSLFRQQAGLRPADPLLQYLLAEQLSASADRDPATLAAAISAARRSTELDATYKAAHDLLAMLYVRAREPQRAIEQADMALRQDPEDQSALYQKMMAVRMTGNRETVAAMTQRLKLAQERNREAQQQADRYRLQDDPL